MLGRNGFDAFEAPALPPNSSTRSVRGRSPWFLPVVALTMVVWRGLPAVPRRSWFCHPQGMSLFKSCAMPERRIVLAPAASDIGVLPLDTLRDILLRLQAKGALPPPPGLPVVEVLIIANYNDDEGCDVLVDIMDLSGQIVKKVRGMEGDRATSVSLDCVFVRKIDDSCSSYRLFNPMGEELYYLLPDKLLDPATGALYRIPDNFADYWSLVEPKYLFGQVACTGEYKIFRMLFHFCIGFRRRQMFEVCTLNSSSCEGWRAAPLEEAIQMGRFASVEINGFVYCLCFHAHHSITFDKQVSEKDLIFTFNLDKQVSEKDLIFTFNLRSSFLMMLI